MANKSLFASLKSRFVRADTVNEAGGPAYKLDAKHALAQLAATGCFNGTYYAQADEQLATLQPLGNESPAVLQDDGYGLLVQIQSFLGPKPKATAEFTPCQGRKQLVWVAHQYSRSKLIPRSASLADNS